MSISTTEASKRKTDSVQDTDTATSSRTAAMSVASSSGPLPSSVESDDPVLKEMDQALSQFFTRASDGCFFSQSTELHEQVQGTKPNLNNQQAGSSGAGSTLTATVTKSSTKQQIVQRS